MKDGKAIIAVREVAETLGFKVDYVQKDGKEYVTLKNDTRTMTLEISIHSYVSAPSKEDMVGIAVSVNYGVAPYIVEGRTYAAAQLFEAMMGFDVAVKGDPVTISARSYEIVKRESKGFPFFFSVCYFEAERSPVASHGLRSWRWHPACTFSNSSWCEPSSAPMSTDTILMCAQNVVIAVTNHKDFTGIGVPNSAQGIGNHLPLWEIGHP